MANEVLAKYGTPVVWADTTDYSSTVSGLSRTAQIDLTSVAAGAARQGAKVDLGATHYQRYRVLVAFEFASSAASDERVDVYFAESPSSTAANANPGGASGSDAGYTGTSGDSIADSVKQLTGPFTFVTTADNTTTVQYGAIGTLDVTARYLSPVVVNNSSGAFVSDAVEMYIALIPVTDEIQ